MSYTKLSDYVESPGNVQICRHFCIKRLQQLWPDKQVHVPNVVDIVLQEALDAAVGPFGSYRSWSFTKENVSQVNVAIWAHVKVASERLLRGLDQTPETHIDLLFAEKASSAVEDRADDIAVEKEHPALEERHRKLWAE